MQNKRKNKALYSFLSVLILGVGVFIPFFNADSASYEIWDFEEFTDNTSIVSQSDAWTDLTPTPTGNSVAWESLIFDGSNMRLHSRRRSSDFVWDKVQFDFTESIQNGFLYFDYRADSTGSTKGFRMQFANDTEIKFFIDVTTAGNLTTGIVGQGTEIHATGLNMSTWYNVGLEWFQEGADCSLRMSLDEGEWSEWHEFTTATCWGDGEGFLEYITIQGLGGGADVSDIYIDNINYGDDIFGPQAPETFPASFTDKVYFGDTSQAWNLYFVSGTDPYNLQADFYYRNTQYSHIAVRVDTSTVSTSAFPDIFIDTAEISDSPTDFKLAEISLTNIAGAEACFSARLQNGPGLGAEGTLWTPIGGLCQTVDVSIDIDETDGFVGGIEYKPCSFNEIGGCFINAALFLFVPQEEHLPALTLVHNQLITSFPFRYIYDLHDSLEGQGVGSDTNFIFSLGADDNPFGWEITFFNSAWIVDSDFMPASTWAIFRNLMGAAVWLLLPLYIYKVIMRLRGNMLE